MTSTAWSNVRVVAAGPAMPKRKALRDGRAATKDLTNSAIHLERIRGSIWMDSDALAPPGPGGRPTAAVGPMLLAVQRGDLIFDAKLLAFKFRDYEVVGVRSVLFFIDEVFEFSMLGPQGFHVLCHGHIDPPISDRNVTPADANPSRQSL
jgi:hypothetical protein